MPIGDDGIAANIASLHDARPFCASPLHITSIMCHNSHTVPIPDKKRFRRTGCVQVPTSNEENDRTKDYRTAW